jgi:hypothetical protein
MAGSSAPMTSATGNAMWRSTRAITANGEVSVQVPKLSGGGILHYR